MARIRTLMAIVLVAPLLGGLPGCSYLGDLFGSKEQPFETGSIEKSSRMLDFTTARIGEVTAAAAGLAAYIADCWVAGDPNYTMTGPIARADGGLQLALITTETGEAVEALRLVLSDAPEARLQIKAFGPLAHQQYADRILAGVHRGTMGKRDCN